MAGSMERMDTHMKTMRETHEKMMQAKSPSEREALMAMHRKQMKDGLTMMGDMAGMKGMGGMHGMGPMGSDMAMRHQMMERRMEMMHSTMQMMMDQMLQAPAKP